MIETGTILQDRYLVAKQIGAGGMGAVYVGTDQRFGSTVAIKETFFSEENLKRAFEREARLLNNLRHPALPRVSDHFVDGNGQFLVMEYIPGEDLSEMMSKRESAFSVSEVMTWADQLLDALDYLHTQEMPVVHRDIKPQNLKLTPRGQIILLDFGLAKGNPTDSNHQTNTKSIFGYSRIYAPLEQIQGTGTDPRSDFYSLAATIYHLMTGAAPEDALTRATAVLNGQPDPLRPPNSIRPEISPAVSEVLMNAMALNANFRPSSAAAMRVLLADAKNNISDGSDLDTLVSFPVGTIFDQKTQVIGGENTATSPVAGANATEQNQGTRYDGAIEIPIPGTVAHAKGFASTGPQKKRSRSWLGVAAAAAVLLVAGCAAGFYFYNPGMFTQTGAPVNSGAAENPAESEAIPAVNSAENTAEAPAAAAAANGGTTGETKEPVVKSPEGKGSKEVAGTKSEPKDDVDTDDTDDEEQNAAEEEALKAAARNARTEAERRAVQQEIQRMVQRRLRQANMKYPNRNPDGSLNPPPPGNVRIYQPPRYPLPQRRIRKP
jgi:serine/threonine protein kinase